VKESFYYTESFYDGHGDGSYNSAKVILPIINEVFKPQSVLDVGCGVGAWLKVWKEDLGVKEIQGVEGPYVTAEMLMIPKENVIFQDLKLPLELHKKFDLVMSLEVAEHLPESQAKKFIQTLTEHGDIVLFSAAIEGQEGTYHINEQMPEYWCQLFEERGYVPVDYIRPKIWGADRVEWWYQQNLLIYIKRELLDKYPVLHEAYKNTNPKYLLRIHPWLFRYKLKRISKTSTFIGFIRWKLYPLKKRFKALKK